MQASEVKLRQLIEGTKQYVVPLFQRPYSWSEKQWKTLWVDVLEKAHHADGRPHFFGSIVTAPAKSVPHGVGKFLLVDGQQRLTTVQVLLAALRDAADSQESAHLRDRIAGQYLANAYETDDERLKVLPTQDDRAAFRAIVSGGDVPPSRLRTCYEFFRAKLRGKSPEDLDAIHRATVDRLSLVSITCDEYDNPHLIFESLNAKGEKLTPADLIRNFLLMQVHVNDQERVFKAHWLPIQDALRDHLTEFVRHYLMKEGKVLQEAEIYFELKERLANSTPALAEAFLKGLHRHGSFYARFVDPRTEPDREIGERLDRIRRLKVTVAYPFLLRVFDAHETGQLSRDQLMTTLDVVESFVVRRAVCGVPTNQLRRIFPPVFDNARGAGPNFLDGLRERLGGSRCPDDKTFADALETKPLYAAGDKNERLRLILQRLERSYGHKEPADLASASIEHVLPQTPTPEWLEELGDDASNKHDQHVHLLGNLTLSAYNPELSNRPYAEKRKAFGESHFVLNQHFVDVERWNDDAIRQRGAALAGQSLEIWPDVGRDADPPSGAKQPAPRPRAVRFRGDEQSCQNWKDGFVRLIRSFESARPGLLTQLADEAAFISVMSRDSNQFPRSKTQIGDVYLNTHASARQLQDWLSRIAERAGFPEKDYEFLFRDPAGASEEG